MSYSPVYAFSEVRKRNSVTAPAQTSIGTTAGQALSANTDGKGFWIVNTGTTVIKVVLGTGTPTQTAYHFPLKACATADDGTGGDYCDDQWTGAVQIISDDAGGTCVIGRIS